MQTTYEPTATVTRAKAAAQAAARAAVVYALALNTAARTKSEQDAKLAASTGEAVDSLLSDFAEAIVEILDAMKTRGSRFLFLTK